MNIKDEYVNRKVTFDTPDGLEEKIDRLTSMMKKLTTQDVDPVKSFKPKIYQSKRRGQTRKYVIDRIMIKEIIKIDIDQIVEIGEFHFVVEYNMDKTAEIDQGTFRII